MPVTFNNKSGTITADGCNLMDSGYKSEYGDRFPRSVWWIGAAAVCLGLLYLLLLIIILAMVAQHIGPTPLKDAKPLPLSVVGCDNLTLQCFHLQSKYNTLLESNNKLENKLCSLSKEKDTVTGVRDSLQNERDGLQNERDTLQKERNTLHSEHDALKYQRDTLQKEHDALQKEQETLRNEQESLKSERDALKESLQSNMDTLQNEKNALKSERDTIQNEKDTLQNERDTIMTERDSLRDERDFLKLVSSNLTKELELLQSRFNTVVESRDGLKEEAKELNQNRTEKLCPLDWVKYQEKCYYISKKGSTHSWHASRRDCQDRGGDLAIITTRQEQDFVTTYYDRLWIGLSDLDQEGKWKWVNGEELDFKGFWQRREPNNSDGNEDCVEVSRAGRGWNDAPCRVQLSWVCED
ncbi:C-type lectin domain family 10 member A-like [Dunckerocampus dactyliophorus]|uniref:C-type lectin domain family 10 member A-like n=1 Tax=Dunckerocampus dactyliophorus TaxID=161453 RepID=UPI0024060013|nr:C-type lectin domain family 10 member A-like [Dunckerocampus dactyliophorus]